MSIHFLTSSVRTSCSLSWLTECDIFVQYGFKVASKAMEHRVTTNCESEALIPVIVHVWKRKETTVNFFLCRILKTCLSCTLEVSVFPSTCCWVCEGEARFGVSQLMEVMETHDVGSLEMALGVLVALAAAAHFVVKLGGGQRSQEGGVGAGDADSVIWRWEDEMGGEKRKWWVMQRSIGGNEG